MVHSILAATDGSPNAQRALRWAACLAELTDATLTVMGVDSVHQAEVTPEFFAERSRDFTARLQAWVADVGIGDPAAVAIFRKGRPADEIAAEADALSPDLIVVGARGGGGFTSLGLGSTTHQLAHCTRHPLAAVHEVSDVGPGTRLVVGVDGSPGSAEALTWAADLGAVLSVTPTAVFVHDPLADTYPHPHTETWKYQHQSDAEAVVAQVNQVCEVEITILNRSGNAVEELARVADELAPSIVVVGTRSHGLAKHRLLGRVPMELLHHCTQPVVLVPYTPNGQ